MRDLISAPWFAITGWVLTAIGTISGIVLYFRARSIIVPVFHSRSSVIIDKTQRMQNLEVRYKGSVIKDNIHYILISFWNRGRKVIESTDLVNKDPLRLVANGCNILDINIRQESNKNNDFKLVPANDGSYGIAFDFVAKGDGVLISIIVSSSLEPNLAESPTTWTQRVSEQVRIVGAFKTASLVEYRRDLDVIGKTLSAVVATITGMNLKRAPLMFRILSGILYSVAIFALTPLLLPIAILDGMRNAMLRAMDSPFM